MTDVTLNQVVKYIPSNEIVTVVKINVVTEAYKVYGGKKRGYITIEPGIKSIVLQFADGEKTIGGLEDIEEVISNE